MEKTGKVGKAKPQTELELAGATKLANVTPINAALASKTEKDLDAAVANVFTLKVKSAMGMWELGRQIASIVDGQLWKLRNGTDGKPRYKTAESFCTEELGMSVTHAWNLAEVSKHYDEQAVAKFGPTKLGLSLQAPPEAQPALRQAVEGGATKKLVASEVKKANVGRKTMKHKTGKKAGQEVARTVHKTDTGKKTITVASILGTQTLRFYKKASVTSGEDKKSWIPAKKAGDVPYCTMELENDVTAHFTVMEHGDGTIKLKVEIKRND